MLFGDKQVGQRRRALRPPASAAASEDAIDMMVAFKAVVQKQARLEDREK